MGNPYVLAEVVERLEKEFGFKLISSKSDPIPHVVFQKELGDDIHFISLWNKTDDPKVDDWTILSEMQSGLTIPYEVPFKAYELFRDFIYCMKRSF